MEGVLEVLWVLELLGYVLVVELAASSHTGASEFTMRHFHLLSLTFFLQNQKDPHKLSEQQEALCDGQNPLPIYVSVCVRDSYSTNDFKGKDVLWDPLRLKLAAEFQSSLFPSW